MLDEIIRSIESRQLTVLVTHWWEYFPDGKPKEDFIRVLAPDGRVSRLAGDIKVVSFADVAEGGMRLN